MTDRQTDLSALCWLQAAELIIHSKNNLSYLWQTNGGTEDIITVVQQNKVEMVWLSFKNGWEW